MRLAPKAALSFNAWFPLASGLQLVASPGTVGDWFGISIDGWLRLLGIVLLAHAVLISLMLCSLPG